MSKDVFQTSDGKYTFINDRGTIDINRYSEPWIQEWTAPGERAVLTLIFDAIELRRRVAELERQLIETGTSLGEASDQIKSLEADLEDRADE